MITTDDDVVADRCRIMSLHRESAVTQWKRYTAEGSWALRDHPRPGFKVQPPRISRPRSGLRTARQARHDVAHGGRRRSPAATMPRFAGRTELQLAGAQRDSTSTPWHLYMLRLDNERPGAVGATSSSTRPAPGATSGRACTSFPAAPPPLLLPATHLPATAPTDFPGRETTAEVSLREVSFADLQQDVRKRERRRTCDRGGPRVRSMHGACEAMRVQVSPFDLRSTNGIARRQGSSCRDESPTDPAELSAAIRGQRSAASASPFVFPAGSAGRRPGCAACSKARRLATRPFDNGW